MIHNQYVLWTYWPGDVITQLEGFAFRSNTISIQFFLDNACFYATLAAFYKVNKILTWGLRPRTLA